MLRGGGSGGVNFYPRGNERVDKRLRGAVGLRRWRKILDFYEYADSFEVENHMIPHFEPL